MKMINVVIADDHAVLRAGIRAILNLSKRINVVGEAGNGVEALEQVKKLSPDLLILDMEMPVMDGLEVARSLKRDHSPVKILVLSAYNDPHYIQQVMELGASEYLIKDEAPEVLVVAVHRIMDSTSSQI